MAFKMNLSHANYRAACNQAFRFTMVNPTVYWNKNVGFYVAPSRDIAPNRDLCIGLAYYDRPSYRDRSLSGSRREYQPIAAGIREYYSTSPDQRFGPLADYVQDARFDAVMRGRPKKTGYAIF